LGASNRLEGVLNLESPLPNAFSKQDRYILQIFATQAVSAIQEARLIDALQNISALLLTQSQQKMLDHLVEQASNLLNAIVGLIWMREGDKLILRAATNIRLQGEEISLDTFTGQVIKTGEPYVTSDLSQDPYFTRKDMVLEHGWGSALSVPIFSDGDTLPVGVFSVYTQESDRREFNTNEWDTKVMSTLAHYASLAIQNSARQAALKAAQEQQAVAEMFAVVGDVAANLMHRLNNKVGTIPVRVEGIEDKLKIDQLSNEYLLRNMDEIKNSSTEAMRIVQESLFHLKPVSLTPVHIGDCIEDAVNTVAPSDPISLHIDGMENLPLIMADRTRLALVFTNLIENAISAMDGSGQISIHGDVHNERIEICFSDTGPGIPPELHEKIFEFRYSGRRSEHPGKLGFGLWWVKTLMVRMNGIILINSDGKNGTTFIMRFPHMN
jgi:signal transduction histidine kinase